MAKKKKLYDDMSPTEKEQAVRRLMQAGGSNASVAKELDTTPNAIAGLRQRKNIPSLNKAPSMGQKPAPKQQKVGAKPRVPGLEEAKSEASRCEYKHMHCPYEAKVGSPFCLLHQEEEPRRS